MLPNYEDLSNLIDSSLSYKYRLFRYSDSSVVSSRTDCVPVLFVPGSVGSYRQVRSLASTILREMKGQSGCYEFFAVDFRQEFVAFSSGLLRTQASYVNDVAAYLLRRLGHVDSFVLVGHSFGGVVLRLAETLKDYPLKEHRVFKLLISTPHRNAPFVASSSMVSLYKEISEPEKGSFTLNIVSSGSDILVPSNLSKLDSLSSITVRVDQLGGNWADPNHQAMVWEQGLMQSLSNIFTVIMKDSSLKNIEGMKKATSDFVAARQSSSFITKQTKSIQCNSIVGLSKLDNSIDGICSATQRTVCATFDINGPFQIATTETFEKISVFFGQSVRTSPDALQIDGSSVVQLSVDTLPQRIFKLDTITDATTQITELITRLEGAHSGVVVVVLDCRADRLHRMSLNRWQTLVVDGSSIYRYLQGKTSLSIRPANEKRTKILDFGYLGAIRLLLGKAEFLAVGDNTFTVTGLSCSTTLEIDGDVVIWTVDNFGKRHYGFGTSFGTQRITLNFETREMVIYSSKISRSTLHLKLLETIAGDVIENLGQLFINFYMANIILPRIGFAKTIFILLVKAWTVDTISLDFINLLTVLIIMLWIVGLGKLAGSRISLLTALLPTILVLTFAIRNFLILVQEIGLWKVLRHTTRYDHDLGFCNFIALCAVFLEMKLPRHVSSVAHFGQTAVLLGLALAIRSPYQLSYLHAAKLILGRSI